jgi:predicted DNA-binding transcriptional regulator AlpA
MSDAPKVRRPRRKVPLPPVPDHLATETLLTVREVAALRRSGVSTVWRDVARGTFLRPIYVTSRAPRWRLADVRAIIAARATAAAE